MDPWEIKEMILLKWTNLMIWVIQKSNKHKDMSLSTHLHRVADKYDRRPTGKWDKG